MRALLVLTTLLSTVQLAAVTYAADPVPAGKPNIVMIISDDQGWTDFSFMGHPAVQTPALDRLAAQSLLFPRGYVTAPLCCPSLASIVTGLHPHQHKITSNDPPLQPGEKAGSPKNTDAFAAGRERMNKHLEAVPTIPSLLAKQGYVSFQTGKWWQGDFHRGGFTHGMTKGSRHGDEGLKIGRETMEPIYDFIHQARSNDKPFFVWYAPMLPHSPHNPPERLLEKYRGKTPSIQVARYWAMCDWFDETCGQLLDFLDREKLADNTIVLFVVDNGWIQSENSGESVRSKLTPYDGGVRSPIMIRWPGHAKPGRSEALAQSIDFAPTILAALGEKPTEAMQGINLLDAEAVAKRTFVTGGCFTHNAVDLDDPAKNVKFRWIVEGTWKLIQPVAQETPPQLYDLAADPGEKNDLASAHPDKIAPLRQRLDAWWNPKP